MSRASLLLLAALVTAGCGGDGGDAPVSGEPRPLRDGPTRPPQAHVEGNYALDYAEGTGLPAVIRRSNGCHTEIVEAALRLEAGRFAFQSTTREVCGGEPGEEETQAAGGTYSLDGNQVTFRAETGGAFTQAVGVADDESILIQQLTTQAGVEHIAWRFDRPGPELVPEEGVR
ncbi:MAG TPA: hypothetical protein VK929_07750 [Longimicrobiales bacterium]|nr:hypothetical protein [Longimicrobiales bacterium]